MIVWTCVALKCHFSCQFTLNFTSTPHRNKNEMNYSTQKIILVWMCFIGPTGQIWPKSKKSEKNLKINEVPDLAPSCTGSSCEVGLAALTELKEGWEGGAGHVIWDLISGAEHVTWRGARHVTEGVTCNQEGNVLCVWKGVQCRKCENREYSRYLLLNSTCSVS